MSESIKNHEATVMRMAGNIAGSMLADFDPQDADYAVPLAREAVKIARAIVAEVQRTAAVLPPRPDPATEP